MKVLSFSGGKDSTAMLLRMLELGQQIDEIVFSDTGFEFPELYDYIKRVEKYIGRKVTILQPNKNFKEWFNGKVTRGNNEGKVRGFPLVAYPCWWTREAKIVPLQRFQKKATEVYIGIAYDEKERMSAIDGKLKYPLVEWGWSEADCVDYLNKKGMLNPLYVNFDRLGCYFCPKQNQNSLYVLWKMYPKLWEDFKWWDNETKRLTGEWIKLTPLTTFEDKFKEGWIPRKMPEYECWNGCEGVKRAFKEKQCGLNKFVNCGESE